MEQIISQDGTRLACVRSGIGPPLLLVHGGTADHTRWTPVLAALGQQYSLYAMDRRGRGGSGDAPTYALAREVEDIVAVVEAIGGPVNVLGHSFGAACALEAALRTSRVQRLILYEPPPPGIPGTMPPLVAEQMRQQLAVDDREAVLTTFFEAVARVPPHEIALLRSAPSWQGRLAAAHTILREIESLEQSPRFNPQLFASFTTPTCLLLGGDSPALYREHIEALHAALPSSQIVVLPGQQHVAMNTAPDLFVQVVLEFLQASV